MSITTITPDELTQGIVLRKTMEALLKVTKEMDALRADAERYDYLLTKRLGWLSNRAPIPWGKQNMKEAMSAAIDLAMKGTS